MQSFKYTLIILAIIILMSTTASAQRSGSALTANTPPDVRLFIQQLDKLSEEEVSRKAAEIASKVLGELEHGPRLERSKNRRASYQALREKKQASLESTLAAEADLKSWLKQQRDRLKAHHKVENEHAFKDRFRALVAEHTGQLQAYAQRATDLKAQIAELDERVNDEVADEQRLVDRLLVAQRGDQSKRIKKLPEPVAPSWGRKKSTPEKSKATPKHNAQVDQFFNELMDSDN